MAEVQSNKVRKAKKENDMNKESVIYFMENLDDPEIIFNRVWFLWNSTTPNFSWIHAK